MSSKQCGRLLIGMTGSIALADSASFLPLLKREFTDSITAMMSDSATTMMSPNVISILAGGEVVTGWRVADTVSIPHISLPRSADLFVVWPATGNIICKAANGIADDLISSAIAAAPEPVVFAPVMNVQVWESAPVRRAVAQLREDGHYVIEPEPANSLTEAGEARSRAVPALKLLAHLRHVLSKRVARAYFAEATSEKPRTPAEVKLLQISKKSEVAQEVVNG